MSNLLKYSETCFSVGTSEIFENFLNAFLLFNSSITFDSSQSKNKDIKNILMQITHISLFLSPFYSIRFLILYSQ